MAITCAMDQRSSTIELTTIPCLVCCWRLDTQVNLQHVVPAHSGIIWAVVLPIQVFVALLGKGQTTGFRIIVVLQHALRHHSFWDLREALPEVMQHLNINLLASLCHCQDWMDYWNSYRGWMSMGLPVPTIFRPFWHFHRSLLRGFHCCAGAACGPPSTAPGLTLPSRAEPRTSLTPSLSAPLTPSHSLSLSTY